MTEVTYGDFSRLAKKRGWTVEMLVELFKGKTGIEDRSDRYHEPLASYFERVLSRQWLNPETKRMEDRSNVVIAYCSIIEFYLKDEDLKSLSDERSIQFVLVYLPLRDELMGSYPTEWMEFMRHESKARGIPLVDIVSDFRLLPANEIARMYIPGARPWGNHLNESGNAFVARVIYDTLRNHPSTAEILFPPERDQ